MLQMVQTLLLLFHFDEDNVLTSLSGGFRKWRVTQEQTLRMNN